MSDWYKQIFNSPAFSDSELTRFAQIANTLSLIPMIYGISVGIMLWVYESLPKFHIFIFILCVIIILIASYVLLRKGAIHIARSLLVTWQWISMTIVIVFIYKGNFSHAIDSYLLVIFFAGLLLGEKTALVFAILNLVSLLTISLFIPDSFSISFDPKIGNVIHLINFLVVTALVIFGDRYLKRSYQAVKEKEQELIKNNLELLDIRAHLEKDVDAHSKEIDKQKFHFEALVKNSPLAIVILDLHHRVIGCNPAFEYLFGYAENEVVDTNLDDLITNPDVFAEAQSYTQRALNGETLYATGKRRTKDGQMIDVEIYGVPVMVENQMIGIYALYNDISNRALTEKALRESEEQHRNLFENVPIPLWEQDFSEIKAFIESLQGNGITEMKTYFDEHPEAVAFCTRLAKIINLNHAALSLYGAQTKEELIGSLDSIVGEESLESFKEEILYLLEGNTRFVKEIVNRTLAGQLLTVRLDLSLAPGYEDSWAKVFVSTTDITTQKQAQDELKASENRQRLILESMPVLMFAMDDKNIITSWNQACEVTTGYRASEIINNSKAIELLFPDSEYRKFVLNELQRQGTEFSELELEFTGKNGQKKTISWSNISSRLPIPGWNFWAIGVDITERKAAEEQLKYLASHDTLTDLPNRALFNDRLNHALSLAKRNQHIIAVIFLDLDNFKMVNDTLGHEKGDELLIEVAQRITKCLRKSDTVARIGGDEFAFVLENITSRTDIIQILNKIFIAISAPIVIGGHVWNITPSVGVTLYPEDGEDAETLLKKADIAMYEVKERGKNDFHFFSPESDITQ
ncbi:MAG: diguanylate cyclase [Anaerolineales bacterium]|nr:diguanylate cyclase [Anaerolineales bacterium]